MKNQKHAVLMAPDKQFDALQSQEGNALFFSIGTDDVFYLTRETPEGSHGWSRIDLSSALSAQNNNAKIKAKLFDVAQDPGSNSIYIALAITVNAVDLLYSVVLSTDTINGWANADADWADIAANGIAWTAMDFDAGNDNKATLNISDINIFQGNQVEFIQADIIQGGSNAGDYVNRYYVDPNQGSGYYWNPVDLPAAMSSGNIHNEIGYLYAAEDAPGTYTLSGLKALGSTEMELIFLPFYNAFDSDHPEDPSHITFRLPANTTAIASSQAIGTGDPSNYIPDDTDLFVAAGSSLYFVPHNTQTLGNVASGLIYTHDNLSGVQSLHVDNTDAQTVLWGLNEDGNIFYMSCAKGSEGNGAAWSVPAIICSGVEGIATYINGAQNSLVIFAHMNDDSMVQLTQDPTTSHWVYRDIHLPTADPMDMVENYTFTTHIQLTDNNNVPLLNQAITIMPNTACSLYINDTYHALYANTPLSFTCDATGVITLVQSVDSLAGVCFTLDDGDGTKVNVNPMTNVLSNLKGKCASDGSGPDLGVSVHDEMGNSTSLVDSSVSDSDKTAIAQYIAQFIQAQSDVPADGSQQPDDEEAVYDPKRKPDKVYGVYHKDGRLVYYEGMEAMANVRTWLRANRQTKKGLRGNDDGDTTIEVLAGDGWRWLKSKVEDVVHWEIQKFGAINHFIFTIAEQEYHFALRAMHDIANGIHFVLNKIKVAFEDLIRWLGSIFAWKDILTTHAVVKEYLLKYAKYCIDGIDDIKAQVDSIAATVESKISQITGLPGDSYSGSAATNTTDSGQNKPSSNWGNHHTKSNMVNSQCNHETDDPTSLLGDLINAAQKEEQILTGAAQQLDGIFSNIVTSSASAIMEQVLGVLANTVVGSAQNLLDALLTGAADVLTDIEDTLDAPIYIPVISPVYKMFAKADLSIMDFICLMGAVPITVIYKIVNKGNAPFTSDDVNTFANAADFSAIAALCFVQPSAEKTKMLDIPTPPELTTSKMYDKLEFSGNILAAAGGYLVSVFATIRAASDDYANNKWLATGAAVAYLMYVGPDALGQAVVMQEKNNEWYDIMNTAFAGYGVIKALVDLVMVLKKKPASAVKARPALAMAGVAMLGGDDDPPVPNGNNNPPPNPDPANPDPNAPQPGGDDDAEIQEDPLPAGPQIPDDPGPTPSQKFNVPDSDAWDWLSPMLDFGLNAVWNIPVGFVFANSEKKTNDILGLVGNLLFNVSGMIAPICSWGQGPIKWAAIGVADLCNFGYGAMSAATSLDNQPVDS